MKQRSTILKAASVMLSAIILGTSCQKTLEAPEQETAVKASSSFATSGESVQFALRSMTDKEIGYLRISDQHGYPQVEVSMDGSMARNGLGINLLMLNADEAKYASLNEFEYVSEGLNSGKYVSITNPLTDVNGKILSYVDFLGASRGYTVRVYDMSETEMAVSTIK